VAPDAALRLRADGAGIASGPKASPAALCIACFQCSVQQFAKLRGGKAKLGWRCELCGKLCFPIIHVCATDSNACVESTGVSGPDFAPLSSVKACLGCWGQGTPVGGPALAWWLGLVRQAPIQRPLPAACCKSQNAALAREGCWWFRWLSTTTDKGVTGDSSGVKYGASRWNITDVRPSSQVMTRNRRHPPAEGFFVLPDRG